MDCILQFFYIKINFKSKDINNLISYLKIIFSLTLNQNHMKFFLYVG